MKTTLAFFVAVMALTTALSALDNTVVNDFWNTTGYANAAPSAQAATLAGAVDARLKDVVIATASGSFSTFPSPTVVLIR